MKKYRIHYTTENGAQFTLWANAGNLRQTIDELLQKHYLIIGIDRG